MPTFTIRPEQLAAVLEQTDVNLHTAVRRGSALGAHRGQAHMPKKTPTDMGQARNSWRVSAAGGTTRLYNDAPHVLEEGARPHAVSQEGQEAIYQWVLRNLRDDIGWQIRIDRAGDRASGKGRGPNLGDRRDKMARSIMRAIVAKIAREGQAPTYFTRNEMPALTRFARDELNREIKKALNLPPKAKK